MSELADTATKPTGTKPGPNPHGSFIWYELLATDPDAAADFYGKVVGWKTRDSGQPGIDYRLFSAPDADIGGLMKRSEAMPPPVWLGYIGVERSEERRGGKECVSTGRSGCSPHH